MTNPFRWLSQTITELERLECILIDREGVDFQVTWIGIARLEAHMQFVHPM